MQVLTCIPCQAQANTSNRRTGCVSRTGVSFHGPLGQKTDVPHTKASEMSKTTGQAGCLAWMGASLDSRFGAAKSGAIFAVQ
jgi:hypothetical protein